MTGEVTVSESNNETHIEWKIKHFLIRRDNLLISPDFIIFNSKWFLMLHLGSTIALPFPEQYYSFLEPLRMSLLTPYSKIEHHIEYSMGIQSSGGSEIRTKKFESVLKPGFGQTPQRHELISRKDFQSSINSLTHANTLNVFCNVRLLNVGKPAEDISFRSPSFNFPRILLFCDETPRAGEIALDESKNETRIVWKINNFFNIYNIVRNKFSSRGDNVINSPDFILFSAQWHLQICQCGDPHSVSQQSLERRTSLHMSMKRPYGIDLTAEHHIEYIMGMYRSNGSEIRTKRYECLLKSGGSSTHHRCDLVSGEDLDTLVPGNILKVFCIVRLLSDNNSAGVASLLGNFSSSFPMLLDAPMFGKITLDQSNNEARIEWRINHFFQRKDNFIKSPNFILFKSNWFLEIHKYTQISFYEQDTVSLCLQRDYYATAEHHIEYRMGIQKPDGSEIRTEKFESVFQPRFIKKRQERELISGKDFESLSETLTHGNTLKVFCSVRLLSCESPSENVPSPIALTHGSGALYENSKSCSLTGGNRTLSGNSEWESENSEVSCLPKFDFKFGEQFKGTATSSESSKYVCPSKGIHTLSENLESLYQSKRLADVTVNVKDKEFLAHKTILSTRSEVFASMFEHDTSERRNSVVDITDCDPHSFGNFLLYLYTGKLDTVSSSNATCLFKTADKYGVGELKEECVRCMSREMTVNSFCDVFHLAALHGETDLLTNATNFFVRNASAILVTKEWLTLLDEHSSLCNELLVKFAENCSELSNRHNRLTSMKSGHNRVSAKPNKNTF